VELRRDALNEAVLVGVMSIRTSRNYNGLHVKYELGIGLPAVSYIYIYREWISKIKIVDLIPTFISNMVLF
jgi:hypothetical protein